MPITTYTSEEIAQFTRLVGSLKFDEGTLTASEYGKDAQNLRFAAQNLIKSIPRYREGVPQEIRDILKIDIEGLEAQCQNILQATTSKQR